MRKTMSLVTAVACLAVAAALSLGVTSCAKAKEKPVLTMGSWRADDVTAWTNLLAEYKKATGVEIQFKPTNPPDYNATLRLQLDGGTGPDLMFARSYDTGIV